MAPDVGPGGDDEANDDDEVVEAELLDGDEATDGGGELGDLLGSLGGLDMSSLLGSAMELQEQMLAAQQEVANAEYEGQSGGGAVRIVVTGSMEFRSVTIAPEAVDPDDVEMLQDLVLAALHDAVSQAVGAAASNVSAMPGVDLLGGLDLGALLGGTTEHGEDEDENAP
jgi:DNA-binding YbaB/EbfC family protein